VSVLHLPMHGRNHTPGGSDPIPSAYPNLSVCEAHGGSMNTNPAATASTVSYTWTTLKTNDSSIYTIDGSDATKLRIAKGGIYRIVFVVSTSAVPTITGTVKTSISPNDNNGSTLGFQWDSARHIYVSGGITSWKTDRPPWSEHVINANPASNPLPWYVLGRVEADSDTFAFTANIFIERLADNRLL
jgi:hypothetical protein